MSSAILPIAESILPKAAEPIKALAAVAGDILPRAAQKVGPFTGASLKNGVDATKGLLPLTVA